MPKITTHKLYSKDDIKALIMAAKTAQFTSPIEWTHGYTVERMQMLCDLVMDLANCLQSECLTK
jgi:hypothetical protein